MPLWSQASSEQADAQSSPQVSREMLHILDMSIHCHAWVYITCLEIPAENCQWKGISFYIITDQPMNITKINKYNKKTEQYFYNQVKNNQIHS